MDLGTFAFHLGCVCAGYVFAVSLEWFVHNIFFHRMGKKKGSRFGFHYNDHHMGKNPDVNWGVTTEWFDRMMGTREVWLSKAERAALAESDAPTRAQAAR